MPLTDPTGSVLVFHGLSGLANKEDLVIYSNIVIVSSVTIILSNSYVRMYVCTYIDGFPKSSHIFITN